LLNSVGLPADLFTPTFAVSRVSGWTAHILEQSNNNRLIRPEADYIGPMDLHFVPLDKR
jgi:citrate synthase